MKNSATAQYILELAKKHQIFYDKNSAISHLAKKFIELSDDEYFLDDIEQLIVALREKNIITAMEGFSLIAQYNKEAA